MSVPTQATVKQLFALSGNECAFPKCHVPVVDCTSEAIVGHVCHIRARSTGGPRYDPDQTDADRHAFANLVLMCPVHHKVIDSDVVSYTVDRLLQIKADHKIGGGLGELSDDLADRLIANITAGDHATVIFAPQNSGQLAHSIFNFEKPTQESPMVAGEILDCVFGCRPAHETCAFSFWMGFVRLRLWSITEETATQDIEVYLSDPWEPLVLRLVGLMGPELAEASWPMEALGPLDFVLSAQSEKVLPLHLKSKPLDGWLALNIPGSRELELQLDPPPPPVSSKLVLRLREVGGFNGWRLTSRFVATEVLNPAEAPFARRLLKPIRFHPRGKLEVVVDNDW